MIPVRSIGPQSNPSISGLRSLSLHEPGHQVADTIAIPITPKTPENIGDRLELSLAEMSLMPKNGFERNPHHEHVPMQWRNGLPGGKIVSDGLNAAAAALHKNKDFSLRSLYHHAQLAHLRTLLHGVGVPAKRWANVSRRNLTKISSGLLFRAAMAHFQDVLTPAERARIADNAELYRTHLEQIQQQALDFVTLYRNIAMDARVGGPDYFVGQQASLIRLKLAAVMRYLKSFNPEGTSPYHLHCTPAGRDVAAPRTFTFSNNAADLEVSRIQGAITSEQHPPAVLWAQTGPADPRRARSYTLNHHREAAAAFAHARTFVPIAEKRKNILEAAFAGYWHSVQSRITEGDSAVISDFALRAILLERGLKLGPAVDRQTLEIEARLLSKEDFIARAVEISARLLT